MHIKTLFFSFIVLTLPFSLLSLEESPLLQQEYSIKNWDSENGLPQNNVFKIIQTANGYIWLATYDGLVRYDGKKIKTFHTGNTKQFSTDIVTSINVDNQGNLLCIMGKELFLLKHNTFKKIPLPKSKHPFSIETYKGHYYITNENSIYEIKNNTYIKLFDLKNELIQYLKISNSIYIITNKNNVYRYDKTLIKISAQKNYKMIENVSDEMPIFYSESKLYHLINDRLTIVKDSNSIAHNYIKVIERKTFTLYQYENKIAILNHHTNHITTILGSKNVNFSKIQTTFVDVNENIWVGTTTHGLFQIIPKEFNGISSTNSPLEHTGNMIYQDEDSIFWIDSGFKGLYKFNKTKNSFTNVNNIGFPWTILKVKDGDTWIGTLGGLHHTNKDKKQAYTKINSHKIYSIYQDKHKIIWIGTKTGLYYINNDSLIKFGPDYFNNVYSFIEDSKGNIIIASGTGIGIINSNLEFTLKTTKDGLPTNDIRTVYEDESGTYWIGTSKHGLLRYKNKQLYHYKNTHNQLNDNVWSIVEDSLGYFWMSSNNGIYRVKKSNLNDYADQISSSIQSIVFNTTNGVTNTECNSRTQNKGFVAKDGTIWFSTIDGPTYVNPYNITFNSTDFPVIIDHISIDGNTVKYNNTVNISPNQHSITIHYSKPKFKFNNTLNYQIYLDGYHDKWIDNGSSNSITFINLKEGDYILRIKESGSKKETTLNINVKLVIWKTRIFQIIAFVSTTLILLYLLFLIMNSRQKKLNEISRLNKESSLYRAKALESQLNPHFVFNCLSSIQSLYITDNGEKANEYMVMFSQLLRTIIEHTRVFKITIQEEIDMLNQYITLEQLQFDNSFKFNLHVDERIDTTKIYIPSVLLHTVVENAIKHGLKNNPNPILNINFTLKGNRIKVDVIDNGKGIKSRNHLKKHKSRGLELFKERIRLLNIIDNQDISFSSETIKDETETTVSNIVSLTFLIDKISNYENSNNR